MTEQVEQFICITFGVKLEHSFTETIWMIQKAAAKGNWWLAASSRQHARSCIMVSYRVFWWNIKSPRRLSPTNSPNLPPCDFWLFPKINHLWEEGNFRLSMRFRKNTMELLMATERVLCVQLCAVLRCLLWRGLRCHCPMYHVVFSVNISIHYYMAGYLWTDLVIDMHPALPTNPWIFWVSLGPSTMSVT